MLKFTYMMIVDFIGNGVFCPLFIDERFDHIFLISERLVGSGIKVV